MTRAARSIFIFGIYLIVLGAILIGTPNTLLALVRIPPTTEPWIHVLGVAIMGMGMLHVGLVDASAAIWTYMALRSQPQVITERA